MNELTTGPTGPVGPTGPLTVEEEAARVRYHEERASFFAANPEEDVERYVGFETCKACGHSAAAPITSARYHAGLAERGRERLKRDASSDPAGESLPHLPVGAGADDHHGGLPQLLGQRARQAGGPLVEDVAVDTLGGEDLDDVGLLEFPLPETQRLGEGGTSELVSRQVRQGTPQRLVADPLAGLLGEVRPDVEPDGAGGRVPGHQPILRDLKQRRKFHADHCYLYFEVDRARRIVSIETSWLPNLKLVREALGAAGFSRDPRGTWKAHADLGDHVGVMRKVNKVLELQLLEASSLIPEE